jgi:hypothetical protein
MTKTFAMVDLVGVADELRAGSGQERVRKFWKAADAWTTSKSTDISVRLRDRSAVEQARVRVAAFSDSLLVSTDREYVIQDFFKILRSLMSTVERAAGNCYAVVGSGHHIDPEPLPALGAVLMGDNFVPHFVQIAGTGPAFADLFNAEAAIRKRKDWHAAGHKLYALDDAVPQGVDALDHTPFTDLMGNQRLVFVLP